MKKLHLKATLWGLVFFLISALLFSVPVRAQMSAEEIVRKTDVLLRGKSSIGTSSMTIQRPTWTRTMKMDYWSEGDDKFFVHILSPQREKGTTFLKMKDSLYQYLPSAEMRIKISPSMMGQSWMGSDFTNDDLVRESSIVKDYSHKLLGSETIQGNDSYKIELIPKPNAPVVWSKVIIWIRKSDFVPLKEDFYDERGNLVRTMLFENIKRINDRNYPMKWTLIPHNKPGHKTIQEIESLKIDVPIPAHVFTLKNLEKPR